MMLRRYLPYSLYKPLFGDRKKFGLIADPLDKDFINWLDVYEKFYSNTQKGNLGGWVNNLGFQITKNVSLNMKTVVELGPGYVEHIKYHRDKPEKYILIDIKDEFLNTSKNILLDNGYKNVTTLKVVGTKIPLSDSSVDIVFSFHQLEHIVDLDDYLIEIERVLKNGGLLVGAVPCDGGIAWGLGRFFTTRRYCIKNFDFNFDKIICWEHPSFVDYVKKLLDSRFTPQVTTFLPFRIKNMDANLSYSFIYKKNKVELK